MLLVLEKTEAFANTGTPFLFYFAVATNRAVKYGFEHCIWEFKRLPLICPITHRRFNVGVVENVGGAIKQQPS